jgi:hypothetical protein
MKCDVTEYVALCDTCQRVKVEHQRPARLLQPLKILEWKWEEIGMNFKVGLPHTQAGYDSTWVIVDCLTKVAHFIPVKTTYSGAKLVELYLSRTVCLHGVPKKIVSDRGSQFTSKFWKKLHESMDNILVLSLQSFTCQGSCVYMECRRRSCQIEVPSSHPNFGRSFMSPWTLS